MFNFTDIRIEVLVDGPLVSRIITLAETAGVGDYTLLTTLGGMGAQGRWRRDEVTGTTAKQLFVTIVKESDADRVLAAFAPLITSHGLQVVASPSIRIGA